MTTGDKGLLFILSFLYLLSSYSTRLGGAVASCLACLSPDRAVWVRALVGDIVLCSWARYSHSADNSIIKGV